MQPLGRTKIKFPSKRDFHPPKGMQNWWENNRKISKGSARQKLKKDLKSD